MKSELLQKLEEIISKNKHPEVGKGLTYLVLASMMIRSLLDYTKEKNKLILSAKERISQVTRHDDSEIKSELIKDIRVVFKTLSSFPFLSDDEITELSDGCKEIMSKSSRGLGEYMKAYLAPTAWTPLNMFYESVVISKTQRADSILLEGLLYESIAVLPEKELTKEKVVEMVESYYNSKEYSVFKRGRELIASKKGSKQLFVDFSIIPTIAVLIKVTSKNEIKPERNN